MLPALRMGDEMAGEAGDARKRFARLAAACLAVGMVMAAGAGAAGAEVVYNNLPPMSVRDPGSQCLVTGCGVSSFGGEIEMAGTRRRITSVTAVLASFTCQSGVYTSDSCKSEPHAKFSWPATLKVFAANGNAPGALLGEATDTFSVPYKPTPNLPHGNHVGCPMTPEGRGWGTGCHISDAARVTFKGLSITAPQAVIFEISEGPGAGANGEIVNVATNNPYNGNTEQFEGGPPPTVGSDPYPSEAIVNGAPQSGWEGFQPAFKVTASS